MTSEKNGIGVMTHESTFNDLVVESQYMLELQSGSIKKYPILSQLNTSLSLDVFSRAQSDKCIWRLGELQHSPRPNSLYSI